MIAGARIFSAARAFTVLILAAGGGLSASAASRTLDTNAARSIDPPAWLTAARLARVIDRMEAKLEWDIRKIEVRWHGDAAQFRRLHGFDDSVLAFTSGADTSVNLGPRVDTVNFDAVFGHELVHVILRQKHKGAVPRWLEEGLANHLSKHGKVDYAWLSAQPARDVRTLSHPFAGDGGRPASTSARYHYQAATALMELLASKCGGAEDLVALSVGKKLENYLPTLCNIIDLNAEFKAWVAKKARAATPRS